LCRVYLLNLANTLVLLTVSEVEELRRLPP
jgi:hypothetical protein